MEDSSWAPQSVDTERPNVARAYDWYLGGTHNFAADREMGRKALTIEPQVGLVARTNRAYLGRVVRYLLDAGIRQFIDIGSGIPTADNVHQVAARSAPGTRVVYVDHDPIAVAHSKALLEGTDDATVIQADLLEPDRIVDHPELRRLIDPDRPVGLLCFYVVHFVTDDEDPAAILRRLRNAMAPGSYLALSHISSEGHAEADVKAGEELYKRASRAIRIRSHPEIESLFTDFELVEPGLVFLPQWRPDSLEEFWQTPEASWSLGGVGRKP